MGNAHSTRLVAAGVGGLIGLLLLILAVALWQGVGQAEGGREEGGGALAPDFTVVGFDGEPFSLSSVQDRPVFLYFWASWCAPCIEEAPTIEALWPEYRDRGYVFLGLNIWDIEADAQAFIDDLGLSFPLARDAERSVYVDYGVEGLPVAYFLEPGLQIRSRYTGPLDEQTLRTELDRIAEEAS
ncbi:MAG: TlpA family protein disulfide reductase [Dehalococcoidia bacterium]|nr:TlpA family protein disulfide reductase [Dehalococcoidia bacterium]